MAEQIEQIKKRNAQKSYQALCGALYGMGFRFEMDHECMTIDLIAHGKDLPMRLHIAVNAEGALVVLLSLLSLELKAEDRLDMAIAVAAVNNTLEDGCFDYDITTGDLFFRMTASFIESPVTESRFRYMVHCSCEAIDKYNDQFMMLSKGALSLADFLAAHQSNGEN